MNFVRDLSFYTSATVSVWHRKNGKWQLPVQLLLVKGIFLVFTSVHCFTSERLEI